MNLKGYVLSELYMFPGYDIFTTHEHTTCGLDESIYIYTVIAPTLG